MADEPLRRLVVVLNPTAGKGRAGRELIRLRHLLTGQDLEAEVFLTREPGDCARILNDLPLPAGSVVAAAGGDGTVHECGLALLERPEIQLAVIPLGSGNDYASMLGMPSDPYAALDAIVHGRPVRLDVGRAGPHTFLNTAGFALSAAVSRESRETGSVAGLPRYVLAALRAIRQMRPLPIVVDGLHLASEQRVTLMEVGIGPMAGGGFRLTPHADPADGLLDVCIVREMPRWALALLLPRGLRGRHTTNHRHVHYEQVSSFRLKLAADSLIHVDGELAVMPRGEHTIMVEPRAITVRAPRTFARKVADPGARAA